MATGNGQHLCSTVCSFHRGSVARCYTSSCEIHLWFVNWVGVMFQVSEDVLTNSYSFGYLLHNYICLCFFKFTLNIGNNTLQPFIFFIR